MTYCHVTAECRRYAMQLGADEADAEEVEEILSEPAFFPWSAEHILEALVEYDPVTNLHGNCDAYWNDDQCQIGREIREHVLRYWTGAVVTEQAYRLRCRQAEFEEE